MIKAEINRSCTAQQAKAMRKVFEDLGWVEGVDFTDHTNSGADLYSEEEMGDFKRSLEREGPTST